MNQVPASILTLYVGITLDGGGLDIDDVDDRITVKNEGGIAGKVDMDCLSRSLIQLGAVGQLDRAL